MTCTICGNEAHRASSCPKRRKARPGFSEPEFNRPIGEQHGTPRNIDFRSAVRLKEALPEDYYRDGTRESLGGGCGRKIKHPGAE